jgi:hypothetical protein
MALARKGKRHFCATGKVPSGHNSMRKVAFTTNSPFCVAPDPQIQRIRENA